MKAAGQRLIGVALRYSSGIREWTGCLHKAGEFPRGLIGPASIVWRASEDKSETAPRSSAAAEDSSCLVRLHPAMAKAARAAFVRAANEVAHINNGDSKVEVRTFDQQLLTFEITGDRASEVVKSVLKPARLDPATEQVSVERSSGVRQTSIDPSSLSTGLEEVGSGSWSGGCTEWDGVWS